MRGMGVLSGHAFAQGARSGTKSAFAVNSACGLRSGALPMVLRGHPCLSWLPAACRSFILGLAWGGFLLFGYTPFMLIYYYHL